MLLALSGHPPDNLLGLAFDGMVPAAHQLLDAMDQVKCCEEAAQAWFWLCAETAPRKPRLQAVGASNELSRESQQTMPDARAAASRWQAKQWQSDARYFFGEPVTSSSLEALAQQWAGQVAPLIAAQQSWLAGRCVLPAQGWQFHSLNERVADA